MVTVVPVTVHTDGAVLVMVIANPPALTLLKFTVVVLSLMSGNAGMTAVGTAGVIVKVGVNVYVGVKVLVGVNVGVLVGVFVGVNVGVLVFVGVLVAVATGVAVAVGSRFVMVCTTPSSLNEPSHVGSERSQFSDAPSSPGAPNWNMAYSPLSGISSYVYDTGMVNPPRLLLGKIPPS